MCRAKTVLFLTFIAGGLVITAIPGGSGGRSDRQAHGDLWKSPKPVLKRAPKGPASYRGTQENEPVYNVISHGVYDNRSLLGGGRKIIRHDCAGEYPPSIDVAFTMDVGYLAPVLHTALSQDNGMTWSAAPAETLPIYEGADQDPVIDFNETIFGYGVTFLAYTEANAGPADSALLRGSKDVITCLQAFGPFTDIGTGQYFTTFAMIPLYRAYRSCVRFGEGDPYSTLFAYSTDNGSSWSEEIDISATIGAHGFEMKGIDGPLMFDADNDHIAALAMVVLDNGWAEANGFLRNVTYPAYTRSTDDGQTWMDLRLIFGTDGSTYPRGHSIHAAFNDSIHYIGGVQDAGYTAFNNCQDNVIITSDGLAHLTFTMRDTTFGYSGLWHVVVDHPDVSWEYAGYPEDPDLSGESGVAFMPSIARSYDDYVAIGWTEFIQPSGLGDICAFKTYPGYIKGQRQNVTRTQDRDEVYQRFVDILPATEGGGGVEHYLDWIFLYYDPETGNAEDSTLWHLQYEFVLFMPGIDDESTEGSALPKSVRLAQNYPNPFNPATSIEYSVVAAQPVVIDIVNLRGHHVRTLFDGMNAPGRHLVVWDGRNDRGEIVPSGIYFYRLRAGDEEPLTRKMVLLE